MNLAQTSFIRTTQQITTDSENEEGQTLLAGLFGPRMKADGDGFLSQIRSQMLVSSLERYDC